jgi:nucleotide-binding universal stress UspA family protein
MNYLVPIDFSEQSKNAVLYAASLTKTWPGNLHLLHVIVPMEEETSDISVKTLNVKRNTVFELYQFQEDVRKKFDIRTGSEMVAGDFNSKVARTAARERSNLIIMGTQGMSGLREYLFGSNTIDLIETSTLPVLAVPPGAIFKPFRHIAYLTNHQESNFRNIESLGKIAAKFKAVLSIVSINTTSARKSISEFQASIREMIPFADVNFEDHTHEAGVAEGLEEFSIFRSVDLVSLSTSNVALVRQIAGRGLSEDYTFNVDAPMLFLPE